MNDYTTTSSIFWLYRTDFSLTWLPKFPSKSSPFSSLTDSLSLWSFLLLLSWLNLKESKKAFKNLKTFMKLQIDWWKRTSFKEELLNCLEFKIFILSLFFFSDSNNSYHLFHHHVVIVSSLAILNYSLYHFL